MKQVKRTCIGGLIVIVVSIIAYLITISAYPFGTEDRLAEYYNTIMMIKTAYVIADMFLIVLLSILFSPFTLKHLPNNQV